MIILSYEEYIKKLNLKDCCQSWKEWKMDIFKMSEKEAIKASINKEWGYTPLTTPNKG